MQLRRCAILAVFCLALGSSPLQAQETRQEISAGVTIYGMRGLLTVPSARMDEPGTVRAAVSTLDPYAHGMVGVQIAKPLYLGMRQSAEISRLNDEADRLYPGLDVKLRLLEEGAWHPEISIGWLGATGHKRMAGEYLVLSKRYENFDVSAGLGWGRLGSRDGIGNPLGILGSHFKKERNLDGELPNTAEDWFTGDDVGLFAGMEYQTPWVDGLSLIAEWGADRFIAETAASDYDAPSPWALGARYSPASWIAMTAGIAGGEKILASLSLQSPVKNWPGRFAEKNTLMPMRPYRTGIVEPGAMEQAAQRDHAALYKARANAQIATADLEIDPAASLPRDLGIAARAMGDHAGETIEAIDITPSHLGLRGASIRLMRRDLEQTFARRAGSPEEIWRNAATAQDLPDDLNNRAASSPGFMRSLSLALDTQFSLSEEDHGILYRTSLRAEGQSLLPFGFMGVFLGGAALRLNIADNLDRLDALRTPSLLPVRSDVARFAATRLALDRFYGAKLRSFGKNLHAAAAAGYLEEMYAGFGGDILYRPYGKTWAVGAETWLAFKRNPKTSLHLGLSGDRVLSGHIKGYYEFPGADMTLEARAGRYLNEDIGGTLALSRRFDHGLNVRAFATATDQADADIFGGTTHWHAGLEMTLPLGNLPFTPRSSTLRVKTESFGRDTGQILDNPVDLYAVTEPLSYRHLTQYWNDVMP